LCSALKISSEIRHAAIENSANQQVNGVLVFKINS